MYHVVIHVLWAGTRTRPHLMLLFLLPHPLMSYCLNLPFGTQKRSRMLKASFLPARNWWHRSFYTWRALRVLLSLISRLSLNSSSWEQALDKKRTRFGERGPSKTGQMNSVLGGLGFTSQEWPLWEVHPDALPVEGVGHKGQSPSYLPLPNPGPCSPQRMLLQSQVCPVRNTKEELKKLPKWMVSQIQNMSLKHRIVSCNSEEDTLSVPQVNKVKAEFHYHSLPLRLLQYHYMKCFRKVNHGPHW